LTPLDDMPPLYADADTIAWRAKHPTGRDEFLIEPLLSPRQVAAILHVKRPRLTAMRHAGQGPAVTRTPDGRIRYALSDLVLWQARHAPPAAGPSPTLKRKAAGAGKARGGQKKTERKP
jgi:hypothetical protein